MRSRLQDGRLASGRVDRLLASLLGGVPAADAELRDLVISLLFRWRAGVPVSAFSSFVLALSVILLTGQVWAIVWMIADLSISLGRWRLVSAPHLDTRALRARAAGWLTVLGIVWAALLGIAAALSVVSGHSTLVVLAVAIVAGTVGVVSFRNAPTPRAARIIIVVLTLPLAAAGIVAGDGALLAISLFVIPWCVMLFVLVEQNFEVFCAAARVRIHLRQVARTDPLTGLANRLSFNERVAELADMPRGSKASIACLDLDGFKQINDRFGHDAGDDLLKSVAARLRAAIRDEDDVFRLGGDEFAIVMRNTPLAHADHIIDRLIAEVGRDYDLGLGMTARVGVSVGSAECLGGESEVSEVLRAADRALYRAKEEGRGRHVHHVA